MAVYGSPTESAEAEIVIEREYHPFLTGKHSSTSMFGAF